MQEQPGILDVGLLDGVAAEQVQHPPLESAEQLVDQTLFGPEVVVQVARADVQLVGDAVGGDVRLAVPVEQYQRGLEYAFRGPRGRHEVVRAR